MKYKLKEYVFHTNYVLYHGPFSLPHKVRKASEIEEYVDLMQSIGGDVWEDFQDDIYSQYPLPHIVGESHEHLAFATLYSSDAPNKGKRREWEKDIYCLSGPALAPIVEVEKPSSTVCRKVTEELAVVIEAESEGHALALFQEGKWCWDNTKTYSECHDWFFCPPHWTENKEPVPFPTCVSQKGGEVV